MEDMEQVAKAGDYDTWIELDFKLHDVIGKMAGNKRANQMIDSLNVQWHRVRIGFLACAGSDYTFKS